MKTTKPNWNMKKLQRMYLNNEISFEYPIQRASGQWDDLQKSLLIHSIIGDYPIPPVLIAKANVDGEDKEYVIDGKQRTTTVLNYMSGVADEKGKYPLDAYPLHEETPPVQIEGIEESIDIAGMYFDELHEDVKSELLSASFMIQRLEDASDEVIEELFSRWNNGTPLTKQQKSRAKLGVEKSMIITELMNTKFMREKSNFTPLQRRRGDDEATVLQSMMLLSDDYKMPSNGFVADNIVKFSEEIRSKDISNLKSQIEEYFSFLFESFTNNKNPLLRKLHIPMLVIMAKKSKDEGITMNEFSEWLEVFANDTNGRKTKGVKIKTGYKSYTGAGSVKRHNIEGRIKEMGMHLDKFVDAVRKEKQVELTEDSLTPVTTSYLSDNEADSNDINSHLEIKQEADKDVKNEIEEKDDLFEASNENEEIENTKNKDDLAVFESIFNS